MELVDIQFSFNRALQRAFCMKRLLIASIAILTSGFFFIVSNALGGSSLLPFFLSAALFMPTAMLITRLYCDALKNRQTTISDCIAGSWESLIASSYLFLPLLLTYSALWLVLHIFILLTTIPLIGQLLASFLAFAPLLVHLALLLLALCSIAMLFILPPLITLKGIHYIQAIRIALARVRQDPFSHLLLAILSLAPITAVAAIASAASALTYKGAIIDAAYAPLYALVAMLPIVAFFAPALLFFFQFSAEAYLLLNKWHKRRDVEE